MKILVCAKQVPASGATVSINASKNWVQAEKQSAFKMNRFDEYAVEEALVIKETFPGTTVDVITAGPPRAAETIKRVLGMGADNGIHIITGDKAYVSPFITASRIASVSANKNYDLILAGIMSEDEAHGQTGPMIAELLGLPCSTAVASINISNDSSSVYVEREIEGGRRHCLQITLPAVLCVQAGMNRPRYPSLSNVIKASKNKPEIFNAHELNISHPENRERAVSAEYPEKSRAALFLNGTPDDKAAQLLNMLKEKHLI